jgi:YVTN family beta-propeller protein
MSATRLTRTRRQGVAAVLWIALSAGAAAAQTECVLVASGGLGTITVVDPAAEVATAQIPVGDRPVSVAASPDGRTAWAVNHDEHSVSVVDLVAGITVDAIAVGSSPIDVALHPDGRRLYVTDRRSDRVSVVDLAAGTVVQTISTGAGPAGIVIAADGAVAYTADSFGNRVSVIDLIAQRTVAGIPMGALPFDLALTPDGQRLYVVNSDAGTVSVVDTATRSVLTAIVVGGLPTAIAMHPAGRIAYVAGAPEEGAIAVIDTEAKQAQTMIALGGVVSAVAMSPDGVTAYATEFGFGNLFVLDVRTHAVRSFIPLGSSFATPEGVAVARVPGGCPLPPIPRLAAALQADDVEIEVDRPDALPIGGTLRIEAEVVTYRSLQRRTLREVTRGVLGTVAAAHAAGTLVELVGQAGDANCDGRIGADFPAIMRQLATADPGPCGGDIDGDGRVGRADLHAAQALVFSPE